MNVNDFGFFLVIFYLIGIWVVYAASKQRKMPRWESIIATLVLTPFGGLLYCLCYPSKEQAEINIALKMIHDKLNKWEKKQESSE